MMILKETKIKKNIELDKYKNLARHLANEVEYLLDEIESLKKQLEQSKNKN
jgi:capsule polysaccharide export protein KpsE/RkpR